MFEKSDLPPGPQQQEQESSAASLVTYVPQSRVKGLVTGKPV